MLGYGILSKLKQFSITGTANKLMRSYLTNRTQIIVINEEHSDIIDITYGVLQGSILGPL